LTEQFPIESKNYILQVSNVKADPKKFTANDEKTAILQSKSLTYPIRGDLTLTSKATGKVVDHITNFPLMDAFHMTSKHTLLYKGNNYIVSNLLQLLPGVYTRTRENTGELEAHFNTDKGASFRIVLEPKTQLFYLEAGNSANPIAPLLTKVFGLSDSEIEKYIPKEVWESNKVATAGKEDKIIKALYSRMVYSKDPNVTLPVMIQELKASIEKTELHPETTKALLGSSFTNITPAVFLTTLKNLVQVHKGDRIEDNRDSLEFKKVQNLPDFLATRFRKGQESVQRIKNNLHFGLEKIDQNNPRIRDAIPSKPYSKVYSSYLQKSSLISTPSETNSIESLENVGKVTILGPEEGGIGEERAVPMAARNIDPSHLGILDPARTPESGHAGIDQRFAINAMRDKAGKMYAEVKDLAGKIKHLSVLEMMSSVIGFPDSVEGTTVQAQDHGVLKRVPTKSVNYWVSDPTSMYTYTTNLVPFLNSNSSGRLTMAGKSIPQALSLVDREAPLVQTVMANKQTFAHYLGRKVSTTSKVGGIVVKVNDEEIHLKSKDGSIEKIKAVKNLPFNMKGFFDDEKPLVSLGQDVDKYTAVYENNYTKDGHLALGKNLEVAYLPWKGYNHEDGIVISKAAAEGLSSHHAYKVDYDVVIDTVAKKNLVKRFFPGKFTPEQLANLDDSGYAKVGVVVHNGDPVYAVLEKREPTPEDRILGKLHKFLVNPYRLVTEIWSHEEPGSVVDSHTSGNSIRILLRSVKPLEIGDKLTGLHGNKGIVSLILPDSKMPYNKDTGKTVDLLLNPASVTSRINLGQVMETVASKIAEKTGKPYMVKNYSSNSNVKDLSAELKSHGLKDTENLVDPESGKEYNNILSGKQYILKLYKTTDSNYSARNVGGYDAVGQPVKGGEEGSKAVGYMEVLGLLGSNARHNLKEIGTTKSENNEEYWSKFIRGEALPKPRSTFATTKFLDYLKASGVNVKISKDSLVASPMTDHDIVSQSNGEITEPSILNSRNLEPEEGGLFDQVITGGLRGNKWSHYRLAEPVLNPIFENPVKSILGLSTKEFNDINSGKIGVVKKDNKFHLVDTVNENRFIREVKH
jgi:DNA-directed RNA polymerase subunit beta